MSKKPEFKIVIFPSPHRIFLYGEKEPRLHWGLVITRKGDPALVAHGVYKSIVYAHRGAEKLIKEMGVDWPIEVAED